MKIAIIGGGAAGIFSAIQAGYQNPNAQIFVLEKSPKILSKVKISGGGRCNVTHTPLKITDFAKNYPRGEKFLKKILYEFNAQDTINWFEDKGVALKTEDDGRIFPVSDDSQTIIDTLLAEIHKLKIDIFTSTNVENLEITEEGFLLKILKQKDIFAHKVIIANGGNPKLESFKWLADLGHTIIPPVPSLFTFNIPQHILGELQGLSVSNTKVWLEGTKYEQKGALLITHWGMSAPAILKLSAYSARYLAEINYNTNVHINWLASYTEQKLRDFLEDLKKEHPHKKNKQNPFVEFPKRLWEYFIWKCDIDEEKTYSQLTKANINRLIEFLTNDTHTIKGKTTFKEEFVTAGGVELSEVNHLTMESKIIKNLFFAGEVLDIDGITGGFNFQSAWTTGYIAGKNVGK